MAWVQALLIGGCFGGDGVFGDGHAADPSEVARLPAFHARLTFPCVRVRVRVRVRGCARIHGCTHACIRACTGAVGARAYSAAGRPLFRSSGNAAL